MVAARAAGREQNIQSRLNRDQTGDSPMDEAADLIAGVLKKDNPFEQSETQREIEGDLSNKSETDRLAAQGFGHATKSTGSDVLQRLNAKS